MSDPTTGTSKRAKICHMCGLPLISDSDIIALNHAYHQNHFLCTACSRPLRVGKHYLHNNKPYCAKDYQRLFTYKCARCSGPIMGEAVAITRFKRQLRWHLACFRCKNCNESIAQERYLMDRMGNAYCGVCQIGRDHCEYCNKPLPYIRHKIDHHGLPVCDFCFKVKAKQSSRDKSSTDPNTEDDADKKTRSALPIDELFKKLEQEENKEKLNDDQETTDDELLRSEKSVEESQLTKESKPNKKEKKVIDHSKTLEERRKKYLFEVTSPDKRMLMEEDAIEEMKQTKTQEAIRQNKDLDNDLEEPYRNIVAVEPLASGVDNLYRKDQPLLRSKDTKTVLTAYDFIGNPFDEAKGSIEDISSEVELWRFQQKLSSQRNHDEAKGSKPSKIPLPIGRKKNMGQELNEETSDEELSNSSYLQVMRVINYEDFTPDTFEVKKLNHKDLKKL